MTYPTLTHANTYVTLIVLGYHITRNLPTVGHQMNTLGRFILTRYRSD